MLRRVLVAIATLLAAVAALPAVTASASTADDQTWACESTTEHRLRKYTLEQPGHYYVTFERIPGFESGPPVEVDVPAETFIATTIELKRR